MGRAAKYIGLALIVAPSALSLVNLPGVPAYSYLTSRIGTSTDGLIPLYAGSTIAWSLLPLVALQIMLASIVGSAALPNDEESRARLAKTRTFFCSGTALLVGGVVIFDAWIVLQSFLHTFPGIRPPFEGMAVRGCVLLALVGTALESTRRDLASGIAALVSGDFVARLLSEIRHQIRADSGWSHGADIAAFLGFFGLFVVVLREAPASLRFAWFASVRERLRARWPVVVATVAALAFLVVRIWDLEHHSAQVLEAPIADLILLAGGLVVAVVLDGDSNASRRVGLAIFPPAERALIPYLAAFVANALLRWRVSSLLPKEVEHTVAEVAQHAALLCGLVGLLALAIEVTAFRRAATMLPSG
ncbi:MAG TPA: hypothetical protein VFF73_09685 [Planctomycetota bacterium]|nr:hypothetical protein [Planctomycetota bacterium]